MDTDRQKPVVHVFAVFIRLGDSLFMLYLRVKMGNEYDLPLSKIDELRYNRKLTLANGVKLDDPNSNSTGS